MILKLQKMLDSFKHRNKDLIFLVNEDIKRSEIPKGRIDKKIHVSLEEIFKSFVDRGDNPVT